MTDSKNAAEQRAIIAERKLALINSDCKKEFIDEVATLVASKMDDDTDFNAAIAIVKRSVLPSFKIKRRRKVIIQPAIVKGIKDKKHLKKKRALLVLVWQKVPLKIQLKKIHISKIKE